MASGEDEFSHAHVEVGRESEAKTPKRNRTTNAPVVVSAKRAARSRAPRVAAGLLAVVLPIGAGGYAWHRADIRTELKRAYHSFEIRVDVRERCESGVALDVLWEVGDVRRPALFRNGKFLASLPPFSKGTYHDTDVERGKSYAYAVGSSDLVFIPVGPPPAPYPGMFRPELCVQQKGPYMTFTSEGTRETLFTIEANVPDVDGEPVGYSWNFYGTDFDEREQRFFMPWTPTSAKPRIVHRFADEGANVENDVYRVPVTLRVEFKNGETKNVPRARGCPRAPAGRSLSPVAVAVVEEALGWTEGARCFQ
jgi:hypothetical protein